MKKWLVFTWFLIPFIRPDATYAQAPVYEPFDVDSAASPQGGATMLETFLVVNLQKPFMAQVANATGKVYVKTVVEPNGYVSDVTVLRGFRADCDREAVRVMRLFNAWKPALKGGKAVRQFITYPVVFRANTPVSYVDGKRIDYFDKEYKPATNGPKASFQQTVAIDSVTGLPTGDLTLAEVRGSGKLRELSRLPLLRFVNIPAQTGGKRSYTTGHKQPDGSWYGAAYTLDSAGHLLNCNYGMSGQQTTYTPSGMVLSVKNYGGERGTVRRWFANGQLAHVERFDSTLNQLEGVYPYRLMSGWDSTGHPVVMNGNGRFQHQSAVTSRASADRRVQFIETGTYVDGLKHGMWSGTYSDGSYRYEENFDNGKPLSGTTSINGGPMLTYETSRQNPLFKDGQSGLYQFLGRNIRFPADAMRANIQGRVYVSFTVCTDGTLCDYEVLKGVDPSLDAEAIRVVKASSGQWKPGAQRGEPVRVKYNLPISFVIEQRPATSNYERH